MYVPKINRINDQKNINKIGNTVRDLTNISYGQGINSQMTKGLVTVTVGKSSQSSEKSRIINFDFEDNENGYIDVRGGKIRIHGKRVINVPAKSIQITGGTEGSPSWVYVRLQLSTWTASIEYSLVEPLSNNTEICVPLHNFSSVVQGSSYSYTYLSTCYLGDIQISNLIAD